MSKHYQYENLLREPVEKWSALVYGAGAFLMMATPELLMMPPSIGYAGATIFSFQGLVKFRKARLMRRYQKQLTSLASYTASSNKIGTSKRGLWVGKGFKWDERHTQRLYDLEKAEARQFRELPRLYTFIRTFELKFEHTRLFSKLIQFTSSQHNYNPVKPLPDGGGNPATHAVGMWEGEKNIYVPLTDRVGHTLILGTTRVGKTRLEELLVAQDIRRGDVVIVIDPKGDADLLLRVYAECIAANREDSLQIFHLGYPEISDAYNPIGSFMRLTEVASRIAGQMPGEGQSATFREFVWGYVNTVASALVTMGKRPTYDLIKQHTDTIEILFTEYMEWYFTRKADPDWADIVLFDQNELGKKPDDRHPDFQFKTPRAMYTHQHRTIALYKYYREHSALHNIVGNQLINKVNYDSGHMGKLIASLQPFLDKMTTGDIFSLLVPNGDRPVIDWNEVIEKGGVVYVGLDALSDPEVAAAVGNSMFSDLTSIAGRLYKTGHSHGLPEETRAIKKKERKICLHADEFNELIGKEFIPMLNKAGGAGMQVTAYTQTSSDIEAKLGNAAFTSQVIGNFNTIIMLRVLDAATTDLMVKRQKEVQVITTDLISGASDNSNIDSGVVFSSTATQRQTRVSKPMITHDELLSLPKGQAFALINGNNLYKIRMPLPDQNDFKGLPTNILKIAEDMRSNYTSPEAYQFRFTEYLTNNEYPSLFSVGKELGLVGNDGGVAVHATNELYDTNEQDSAYEAFYG